MSVATVTVPRDKLDLLVEERDRLRQQLRQARRAQHARTVAERNQAQKQVRQLKARLRRERCGWCGLPVTEPCGYGFPHTTQEA